VGNTSDLEESVAAKVSPRVTWPADGKRTKNDFSYAEVAEHLGAAVPRVMIANVDKGGHFVLVVGTSNATTDTLWVRDSGFTDRVSYSLTDDVVGWRLFDITPA
jgi:hypothetical protein